MAISSYSNPIPEIIDGLLRGHQLGLQMQQAARADQEFKTQQAMHNQQMSMQDILNIHTMQNMGLPVSPMGTVDTPSISAKMTAPSGTVSAPMSNAAPTPTPFGDAPALSPAQLPAAMPGTGDQQISMPGYTRKADPSRIATYKTLAGDTIRREIPTAQEQQQQTLAAADLQNQIKSRGEAMIEAAKLKAIQDQADSVLKIRGMDVPPELAAWHHTPPGTKVMPDKLEAMWKEYDTANAAKDVAEGGSLVNPRTGKVIFQGQPKLDDQEKYVQDWLGANSITNPTAADRLKARTAYKHDPTAQAQAQANWEQAHALAVQAGSQREQSHQDTLANQATQRGEMSYRFHAGELDKEAKPIGDLESRVGRLNDTLAQNNPQADAAVAGQLVQILEGGQGSGLRMNQALINSVMGGATKWEQFKSAASQWSLDPKTAKIQPEQRQQMRALANMVSEKVDAKQQALSDARSGLVNTNDPIEHRRILAAAKQKLATIDNPQAAKGGGQTALPTGHKVGDPVTVGGKQYTIGVIHPDGSWDPAPPKGQQSKTVSESELRKRATAQGQNADQAVQAAKQKGYTLVP